MSRGSLEHEAQRWFETALDDLKAVQVLARGEMYAHACFNAQQAAEKAVKALWFGLDADPWGHSIQKLLKEFPDPALRDRYVELRAAAVVLDRYYIPTRYPNGLPDLIPGTTYLETDVRDAWVNALLIITVCHSELTGRGMCLAAPPDQDELLGDG